MSTKDTKASLEAELDSARLQSLYDTSIPSIIKRWKKIIPSSALEYLIEAESQLHSLPSIHSAPEITTEIDTTLKKASSCLSKAYATLLSDHQIPPIPENDSRSLPSPPSSPDQLAAFKTKIGNSQIYVEIVVSKALILYFQSEYQECLRVLNEEVDLPPVGPPSLRGMGIVYLIKGVILKILALEKLSNSPAALDSTSSGCYEYLLKLFPATSASAEDQQQLSQTPSLVTEDVLRSRGTLDNLREGMFRGSLCWTKLWFDQVSKKVLKYKQALKSGTNHVNGNLEPETASIDFSHLTIQTLQFYRLYFKHVDTNLPSDDSQRNKRRIVVNQWFIRFLVIWARLLSENELTDIPSYPPLDDVSLDTDSNAENVHRSPSSSKQPLAVQNNDTNGVPPDYKGQKVVRLFYRELDKAFGTWFDTVISIVPNPKAPAAHDPKSESKSYIIGKDSVEPFTSNKFMEELCDTLMWAELVLNDSSTKHKRKSIEMIYRAFKHTFHSLRIMRHLVVAHTLNYDYVSALAVLHEYVDLAEERLKSAPHLQSAIFPDVLCPTFGSVLRFALDSVKLKKVKFSGFVEYEDGIKELLDVLVMGSQILATELYQIPKAREMCDQALQLLSSHVLSPISQTSNTNGTHPPTENRQVQKKFQQDWQFIICKTYQTVAIVYYMSSNEGSDLERRSRYQLKCIQYLNEALQLNTKNWEIYYQLALVHAERKEILQAKNCIKLSLKYRRSHVPSWHLLALLMTAQKDLNSASRICEMCIRECSLYHFPDMSLAGRASQNASFNGSIFSDHTPEDDIVPKILDSQMFRNRNDVIKELFSVKILHVTILEHLKGTDEAISMCQDLFRWYKKFFDEELQFPYANSTHNLLLDDQDSLSSLVLRPRGGENSSIRSMESNLSAHTTGTASLTGSSKPRKIRRKRPPISEKLFEPAGASSGEGRPSIEISDGRKSLEYGDAVAIGALSKEMYPYDSVRLKTSTSPTQSISRSVQESQSLVPRNSGEKPKRKNEILLNLWLKSAQILMKQNRVEDARRLLQEAENLDPLNVDVWSESANFFLKTGNISKAIQLWKRCLLVRPNHLDSQIGLGKAYMRNGDLTSSECILDDAVKNRGSLNLEVWFLLGQVQKYKKRFDKAKESFSYALQLDKFDPLIGYSTLPKFVSSVIDV